MVQENQPPDIERRVRELLRPDEAVASRVVARAFASRRARKVRIRVSTWGIVVATLVALVGMTVWRSRQGSAEHLTITAKGSFLVVESSDGRRWVVGPGSERRAGGNYVIVVRE
jgi:hypothetical protein